MAARPRAARGTLAAPRPPLWVSPAPPRRTCASHPPPVLSVSCPPPSIPLSRSCPRYVCDSSSHPLYASRRFRRRGRMMRGGRHLGFHRVEGSRAYGTTSPPNVAVVDDLLRRGSWAAVPWGEILSLCPQQQQQQGRQCPNENFESRLETLQRALEARVAGERPVRPRLLVSACLLGHRVNYRGESSGWSRKPSSQCSPLWFLLHVLGARLDIVECVPFCPEMQLLHLPSPRPPVRLVTHRDQHGRITQFVQDVQSKKLLWDCGANRSLHGLPTPNGNAAPAALPAPMLTDASPVASAEEAALGPEWLRSLDGVVMKSKSPSCGVGDAKLFTDGDGGAPVSTATAADGFFTKLFKDAQSRRGPEAPHPPIITERMLRPPQCTSTGNRAVAPGLLLGSFLSDARVHAEWRLQAKGSKVSGSHQQQ